MNVIQNLYELYTFTQISHNPLPDPFRVGDPCLYLCDPKFILY